MRAAVPETVSHTMRLPDVDATAALAETLSRCVRRGDVIALSGELGTGKTTFARALIGALARRAGAPVEGVPSPTFTLVQTYDLPGLAVAHFDLYRIGRPEETLELGLDDAIADGLVLIEWPDRLGPLLPEQRLDIILRSGATAEARIAELMGHGEWARRLSEISDDDLA